ncbi:MAG: exonuclease SbcCD subunit D [Chloroflexota bacterium]|nr:exonuclease SbcCD subunit D [Chloroflexota bacterium]
MRPLRILHFADLHIGMENYGRLDPETGLNQRVADFLARLDQVVDYAIDHEADLVLFAGDAFRSRDPNPTHQREFARRLRRLSELAIPTVLLVGNHDIPVMSQRASSVDIFTALAVPHITVVREPQLLRLETKHGPVQIGALPYPVRQRLLTREQFRRLSQDELDQAVTEIVVGLICELTAQLEPELPAILTGHFSVESAHWGSERAIMVGRDVTVPLSALMDPAWDYVALGHIHQHQNLNPENNPPVVYAGSLERVDFGEEGQSKGFCWVEVQPEETSWRYIKAPARHFQTVRVDVRGSTEPLAEIERAVAQHDLAGAVVRLIVQMTPEQEPYLRDGDLSPLLADTFSAQLNRDVDRTVRDRLAGLEPESMLPGELLKRYLLATGKVTDELTPYLDLAGEIFHPTD